jgi:hypothetical protein
MIKSPKRQSSILEFPHHFFAHSALNEGKEERQQRPRHVLDLKSVIQDSLPPCTLLDKLTTRPMDTIITKQNSHDAAVKFQQRCKPSTQPLKLSPTAERYDKIPVHTLRRKDQSCTIRSIVSNRSAGLPFSSQITTKLGGSQIRNNRSRPGAAQGEIGLFVQCGHEFSQKTQTNAPS